MEQELRLITDDELYKVLNSLRLDKSNYSVYVKMTNSNEYIGPVQGVVLEKQFEGVDGNEAKFDSRVVLVI